MSDRAKAGERADLSLVRGIPLSEEPGLGPLTMPGFVREVTAKYAEQEALVWRGDDAVVRWSYAELWARSVDVARALTACGVVKDTRVGILMTNRPEMLAAAFGTTLAGGVAVLLSTFSTPRELDHLLDLSGVSILMMERRIAGRDFLDVVQELEPGVADTEAGLPLSRRYPFLRRVAVVDPSGAPTGGGAVEDWSDFLSHGASVAPASIDAAWAKTRPSDAGALFFSSGTTSLPKGVLHAHRAVAIQWWRWGRLMGMEAPVRSWTANGFFWSGNFSMVVGGTLASGGSLVLQATYDPEEALQLMQTEQVSFALAWPHQWAKLEDAPSWKSADLSSVRYVKAGTSLALHPTVHSSWLSPPSYGATETLTISTGFASTTPLDVAIDSHGEPLPGNTMKIVDPLTGEVRPRGEPGEILVKGPTLMLGYVGIPLDETLDDEGFFHTGDNGRLDERGRLFWTGRLADVIKTGGANVSPREIDTVLAECPGVRLCQTVGVPHDTLGELVVSCIVPHDGEHLEADAIRAFAKRHLAAYKVPRRVLFFGEDELEKSSSDKVKTANLRALVIERLTRIDVDDGA